MDSAIRKLRFVHANAPLLMQPRIYRVIEAISNSDPQGVGSPILETVKPETTALSILQDNSDSFLALMRTLPKKHKLKEMFGEMQSLVDKLGTKLTESSEELQKLLQGGEEALPGTQVSALSDFATQLGAEKSKLSDMQDLTKILGTLAGKAHKEEKTSPVKHELPSKDVGKKKKKEEEGIGTEPELPGEIPDKTKPGSTSIPDLSNV